MVLIKKKGTIVNDHKQKEKKPKLVWMRRVGQNGQTLSFSLRLIWISRRV